MLILFIGINLRWDPNKYAGKNELLVLKTNPLILKITHLYSLCFFLYDFDVGKEVMVGEGRVGIKFSQKQFCLRNKLS